MIKAAHIWGVEIPLCVLSAEEQRFLNELPKEVPPVEWLWGEMDRVWELYQLDNQKPLAQQTISDFYRHPIWLANGIFTVTDPISRSQRKAIADYLTQSGVMHIADYGGGFGEMGLAIKRANAAARISIIEPYISPVGAERLQAFKNISFDESLRESEYEAVIAQDVLEHVEEPIQLAYAIARSVKSDGMLIFANCFYPVIKCHLPRTFYLRYTFRFVMKNMGLDYVGTVPGAEYAQIFRRNGGLSLPDAEKAARKARLLGALLNRVRGTAWKLRRLKQAVLVRMGS